MVSGPTTFPDSRFRFPNQPARGSRLAADRSRHDCFQRAYSPWATSTAWPRTRTLAILSTRFSARTYVWLGRCISTPCSMCSVSSDFCNPNALTRRRCSQPQTPWLSSPRESMPRARNQRFTHRSICSAVDPAFQQEWSGRSIYKFNWMGSDGKMEVAKTTL
jgi:hypothetical protein